MRLDIRARIEGTLGAIGEMQRRQAPAAIRWTVNALAADIKQATRNTIQQKFRTSAQGLRFLQNHVQILGAHPGARTPRGTGARRAAIYGTAGRDMSMRAAVGVFPPEGKGQFADWARYRGSLLAAMEEGGPTPGPRDFGGKLGLGRYAIPIVKQAARPRMPLRLWPINLGLQSRQGIEGPRTKARLFGKRRTYLIQIAPGHSMVFQRYGRERDATLPLFWTEPTTRLPARRFFFSTADRIVATRLTMHMRAAMQQALFGRGSYRT